MFKLLGSLILFFLIHQGAWTSNSCMSYGILDPEYTSDVITIAYGQENLIYKLNGNEILLYQKPKGTKFEVEREFPGSKDFEPCWMLNTIGDKIPRGQSIDGSFSEMKATFPDGSEYLLVASQKIPLSILIKNMGLDFDAEKFIDLCKKIKIINLKNLSPEDTQAFYIYFSDVMARGKHLENSMIKEENENLLLEYLLNIEDTPIRPYIAALIFNFMIDQNNMYIKSKDFNFENDLDNTRLENTSKALKLLDIIKNSKEEKLKKDFNRIYLLVKAAHDDMLKKNLVILKKLTTEEKLKSLLLKDDSEKSETIEMFSAGELDSKMAMTILNSISDDDFKQEILIKLGEYINDLPQDYAFNFIRNSKKYKKNIIEFFKSKKYMINSKFYQELNEILVNDLIATIAKSPDSEKEGIEILKIFISQKYDISFDLAFKIYSVIADSFGAELIKAGLFDGCGLKSDQALKVINKVSDCYKTDLLKEIFRLKVIWESDDVGLLFGKENIAGCYKEDILKIFVSQKYPISLKLAVKIYTETEDCYQDGLKKAGLFNWCGINKGDK